MLLLLNTIYDVWWPSEKEEEQKSTAERIAKGKMIKPVEKKDFSIQCLAVFIE